MNQKIKVQTAKKEPQRAANIVYCKEELAILPVSMKMMTKKEMIVIKAEIELFPTFNS
jgi:hypothetical protein